MSVLFIALPVALGLASLAVVAFVLATRGGQFDDLQTPPVRILFDDVDAAETRSGGDPEPPRPASSPRPPPR